MPPYSMLQYMMTRSAYILCKHHTNNNLILPLTTIYKDPWADPITLYGEYDWSYIEGQSTNKYCSWDKENDAPTCAGHRYDTGLIYQAHNAGVEVYPSIGGWSLSDPFPVMAANADSRARFAQQCVDLIKSYNFDGIDLGKLVILYCICTMGELVLNVV